MDNALAQALRLPALVHQFDVHVQTRVLGIKYGDWGKQRYPGKKPVKTDALDWYVSRITEVHGRIHKELPAATEESTSTAFVTFRCSCLALPGTSLSLMKPNHCACMSDHEHR